MPAPPIGLVEPDRVDPEAAAKSDVLRIMNYPHAYILQYLCRNNLNRNLPLQGIKGDGESGSAQ
jgi:hypothetical protein